MIYLLITPVQLSLLLVDLVLSNQMLAVPQIITLSKFQLKLTTPSHNIQLHSMKISFNNHFIQNNSQYQILETIYHNKLRDSLSQINQMLINFSADLMNFLLVSDQILFNTFQLQNNNFQFNRHKLLKEKDGDVQLCLA